MGKGLFYVITILWAVAAGPAMAPHSALASDEPLQLSPAAALVSKAPASAASMALKIHGQAARNFYHQVGLLDIQALSEHDMGGMTGRLGYVISTQDINQALLERRLVERATARLLHYLLFFHRMEPQPAFGPVRTKAATSELVYYTPGPAPVRYLAYELVMEGETFTVYSMDTEPPYGWGKDFYEFGSPLRYWAGPFEPETNDESNALNRLVSVRMEPKYPAEWGAEPPWVNGRPAIVLYPAIRGRTATSYVHCSNNCPPGWNHEGCQPCCDCQ